MYDFQSTTKVDQNTTFYMAFYCETKQYIKYCDYIRGIRFLKIVICFRAFEQNFRGENLNMIASWKELKRTLEGLISTGNRIDLPTKHFRGADINREQNRSSH